MPIPKPCVDCGRRTIGGSRCGRCAPRAEVRRQLRQPYRIAYFSPEYRRARARRLRRAGGRCEAILSDGTRCLKIAQETHHLTPLSTARSLRQALALCTEANLRAVCVQHNPRLGPVGSQHGRTG